MIKIGKGRAILQTGNKKQFWKGINMTNKGSQAE